MSYTSEIFAAIGGKKSALELFIKIFKNYETESEKEIFSRFRMIQMNDNCWVYAYHHYSVTWDEAAENAWHVIRHNANFFGFSYVFYRLGDDMKDIEIDEHCAKDVEFYHVLKGLAELHRKIDLDENIHHKIYN